jgi:hypothetical protein|tara:strand:+ start:1586 stop:2044 length:459 start_codon:yes stop_codon:yes gene_type:complete
MKLHHHVTREAYAPPSTRQRVFLRYLVSILIDLVVLNLCAEYWQHVQISSFSITLAAALLLQLLLQGTLIVEHHIAAWFSGRQGYAWRFLRFFSAWLVLFSSKFVMLWAIDLTFGDALQFTGPLHGVVAFLAVIIAMVAAEELVEQVVRRLA